MQESSMMRPEIEGLIERVGSKFATCTLAATRAREINSYFGQLGDGLGAKVPPQVTSVARKPLSISFEEIGADKIIGVPYDPEAEAAAEAAAAEAAAAADAAELTAVLGEGAVEDSSNGDESA